MHPVIASGLAIELDHLTNIVKQNWVWPSPTAGFASWLYRRHDAPSPFAHPTADSTADLLDRLSEAPILSAFGYVLGSSDEPDAPLAEAWASGIQRLADRDPLPGDRQSFFFRPVELLGLALGAATISGRDPQPGQWIREVLRKGSRRVGTDTWSVVLTTYAASASGSPVAAGHVIVTPQTTAVDLAMLWLLLGEAPGAARLVGIHQSLEEVEGLLLDRLALTRTPAPDLAEAAALHVAATNVVRKRLAYTGSRQAALTTITGVLRRFPAVVRELNNRHAKRTPLAEIKDEYDVQDLLRGILRGLFDDVRDEEYTPSHADLTSRMDLLLKREQIVIEAKMTRATLDQRGVAQELAIDKELYRGHPDCRTLVCFVYDPDRRLPNPAALESDLTDPGGTLPTVVIVAPLG